ncbi:hypothetical protein Pmani_025687 [Petrolisthes manimaculis]|uniref:Uncharacterized protein n=1 Tax=Petrolisthes manimaculis TaxID=1843537 RepID=A0AAE1P501_9EUCA|nr:hypothetical protein Pmani_025687 [Petrolisthes manimaculis]
MAETSHDTTSGLWLPKHTTEFKQKITMENIPERENENKREHLSPYHERLGDNANRPPEAVPVTDATRLLS